MVDAEVRAGRMPERRAGQAPERRAGQAPERMCAVTRATGPTEGMLRFVVDPEGAVVVDLKRGLPGRGVWVTANRSLVAEAVRRRVFARAFKRDVAVPDDLAERVEKRLEDAALGALSMARKAGDLVTGFSRVEAALQGGKAVCLLHADDAAEDGIRKLAAAERRVRREESPVPALRVLSSKQMNLALGETNVIHAALLDGAAGRFAFGRVLVLHEFRNEEAGPGVRPESMPEGF